MYILLIVLHPNTFCFLVDVWSSFLYEMDKGIFHCRIALKNPNS